MKTVQQWLCEVDENTLVQEFKWNCPVEFWRLENKGITVEDVYARQEQAFRSFVSEENLKKTLGESMKDIDEGRTYTHEEVWEQLGFHPKKKDPEADELQDFILDLMEKNEVILIRGNHEDLFVQMVTEDKGLPYSHHVSNGTYSTALQLTGYDAVMAQLRNYDFADKAKDTPYYQRIIPSLLDYYETEHYIFTHGWIPCIKERNGAYSYYTTWRDASPHEWMGARWINGMAAAQTATDDDKTIVCGHWHSSYGHSKIERKCSEFGPDADFSPYYGPGIIAVDACTAFSKRINILIIEDEPMENSLAGGSKSRRDQR